MSTNQIETIAPNAESFKRYVTEALFKTLGKPTDYEVLARAAYGKDYVKGEQKDAIVMVLAGIKATIAANKLPLELVRAKGMVTLSSKKGAAKKTAPASKKVTAKKKAA